MGLLFAQKRPPSFEKDERQCLRGATFVRHPVDDLDCTVTGAPGASHPRLLKRGIARVALVPHTTRHLSEWESLRHVSVIAC
jgi:hypothetical protein